MKMRDCLKLILMHCFKGGIVQKVKFPKSGTAIIKYFNCGIDKKSNHQNLKNPAIDQNMLTRKIRNCRFAVSNCLYAGCGKQTCNTYIFFSWMSSKLSGKDVQNSFTHPSAFGKRRESKVVRVDFP